MANIIINEKQPQAELEYQPLPHSSSLRTAFLHQLVTPRPCPQKNIQPLQSLQVRQPPHSTQP